MCFIKESKAIYVKYGEYMETGIKKNRNSNIIKNYELYYDLLRTPDFDEKLRLLY